jgi:hypothetical protein
MTPHTPVDTLRALAAKWRELADAITLGHAPDCDEGAILVCAAELEAALASLPVEGWRTVPRVQKTAPERIWLTVSDDKHDEREPFPENYGEEICWSVDAPVAVCVPYVRADLATPQDQRQGNEQGGTHE